jgi:type III pantothenate kinase
MNLTIDLGNTLAKVGIFDKHRLTEKLLLKDIDEVHAAIKNFSGDGLIISSVNSNPADLLTSAKKIRNVVVLSSRTPVPVRIKYSTPDTLGVDRIAAVCGAYEAFPGTNCLVIDAGTCITCELLDASGNYLGGSISPGLEMRFRAMNAFTRRLPLTSPVDKPRLIGDSTIGSMQSGVVYGIIDEIDGAIERHARQFENLKVILTGGDCRFFENKLKASIFASPELVLRGLNSILLYNIRD